jgi:hypothetical protein
MEWMISALDTYEPDPNGKMQIFGIGTKVRILTMMDRARQNRQTGTVTHIGRRKLTVFIPETGVYRLFYPYLLEVLE